MNPRLIACTLLCASHAAAQPRAGCADLGGYVYKIAFYGSRAQPEQFGAGLFLADDGTLVTAHHLFEEAARATRAVVQVTRGASWEECPVQQILAASRELDLVLARVRLGSNRVRVPRLADSVRVGDEVFGFRVAPPLADWRPHNGIGCTSGRVAAVSPRQITIRGEHFFLPGSSGSPVFNAAGQVVAIALEMVNWKPSEGAPDWTYTGLPVTAALSLPKLARPLSLSDFLVSLRPHSEPQP